MRVVACVRWAVVPGRTVSTCGWMSQDTGTRQRPRGTRSWEDLLTHAHRVAAFFERSWLGTDEGTIRAHHPSPDFDDFGFRVNRRKSRSRGMLFYRLAPIAAAIEPVPYKAIVGGRPKGQ